ncbi:cupin domain-containing protein [Pseudonocardia nematodicida]|uniref:Cupin domain-containing protein n=1 Tax=Pseudonocardia nematodicida TaxID=1206997 RepID=A0ABV1K9Q1_9PSEU
MSFTFRRVVTGHDAAGSAVVESDEIVHSRPRFAGYDARVAWCTSSFPPSNEAMFAVAEDGPSTRGGRVLFRIGEFQPGDVVPSNMHRTETQDVAVVVSGRLDMVLDSGEVVESLGSGDVVVQRGTMHSWAVRGDEPVRVVFVLMDAQPLRVGDTELSEDVSVFDGRLHPMLTSGPSPAPPTR